MLTQRVLEQSAALLAATVAVNNYIGLRAAPEPRNSSASVTVGLHVGLHRQPTSSRLNRSMIMARYSHPYMSLVQTWFGRSSRFGATGRP
jgi:hypothetical protein